MTYRVTELLVATEIEDEPFNFDNLDAFAALYLIMANRHIC
jgi:hypothetical protein